MWQDPPDSQSIWWAFTSSVFTNTTERKLIHTLRRSIRLSPRDWCGACRSSNASERLQILYVLTAPDCMSAAFPVPSLSSLVSNGISSDLYPSRKTPLVRAAATSEPHAEDTLQCFVAAQQRLCEASTLGLRPCQNGVSRVSSDWLPGPDVRASRLAIP